MQDYDEINNENAATGIHLRVERARRVGPVELTDQGLCWRRFWMLAHSSLRPTVRWNRIGVSGSQAK